MTELCDMNGDTPEPLNQVTLNEIYYNCTECKSCIEIISIDEKECCIEFKCINNNHQKKMQIKEYIDKMHQYNDKNINNDVCESHNKNYESYCLDCNCHLCKECLKLRNHINHTKNSIIEIQPNEKELDIIQKIIKFYELQKENLLNEKFQKESELKNELTESKNQISKYKELKIKENEKNKIKELKFNNDKYKADIKNIKIEFENKIKERTLEYEKNIEKINNKYKLINDQIGIISEKNKEKAEIKYLNLIKKYDYNNKIENMTSINRLNEIIYNTYNLYNNNYYNSININNFLINYYNNETNITNDLNNDYQNIMKIKDENKKMDNIKLFNKRVSIDMDLLEKENKFLKKESKDFKEINEQIKKENDDLCETIGNQNKNIKKLGREKELLEKEMKEIKINLAQKQKELLNLKNENIQNKNLYLKTLKEKENLNKNLIEIRNKLNSETKDKMLLKGKIDKLDQYLNEEDYERQQQELYIKELEQKLNNAEKIKDNMMQEKIALIKNIMNKNAFKNFKVGISMLEVDRKDFSEENPYEDSPQRIGFNVNISAPHMHAYALEYLSEFCTENARILDIGSGSGYLTCALSAMTNYKGFVVGVEHIQELINKSINNIRKNHGDLLDNKKIIFVNSDGRLGCKKFAPYKAIHVGAAVEEIPDELLQQLDYGGRMFIPVGKEKKEKTDKGQYIYIVDKDMKGNITKKPILPVSYGMLTDVESQLNKNKK